MLTRFAVAACAVTVMWQLAGIAFVTAPQGSSRVQPVILAGALAASPLNPAIAAEQTYDSFQAPELVAIFLPFFLVFLSFLEWEGKQKDTDGVIGVGTLETQNDDGAYFRRSPESG